MCFRYVCLNGLRMVLGMFWEIFCCQNEDQKANGGFCGIGCFTYVILLFSWFVGAMWGAKMREKQNGIPIWMKTRFYGDFGFILEVILGAKNDEQNQRNFDGFWRDSGGGPRLRFHQS